MSDYRKIRDSLSAPGSRQRMVVVGNPDVIKSAKEPMDVNGRSVTHSPTKVWKDSVEGATPMADMPGKGDGKDIGRPRVITW